jgi:dTDP-glucose 4,6-dehydratase
MHTLLVTGGAGFIGTNFIRNALATHARWRIVNLDALTYAGNAANLADLSEGMPDRYRFVHGDIGDQALTETLFREETPAWVVNFAAESHVDRSIAGPLDFIKTNVMGTSRLLTVCRRYWEQSGRPETFRLLHVSTDEVFGSLGDKGYFRETTAYDPSSPYSASKAASDHMVRAWHRTYGLPVLITNCSNNYGPYQFPEKLIPLMIMNIIERKELPVYGDGGNVRDWLYVMDHCDALTAVLERGMAGETYCIGGGAEWSNIQVVEQLCELLDQRLGRGDSNASRHLIRFVADRPGHDRRYAIDAAKIEHELGWRPRRGFEEGLAATVDWYLDQQTWIDSVRSGDYRRWIENNYAQRGRG